MNRWGIPPELETLIRERDVACVYCGVQLMESVPKGTTRKHAATWEHIVNDFSVVTIQNIARCCNSCNASKGAKDLLTWLESNYCKSKGITRESVACVVRNHIDSTIG
jgi:hypothetical protein